MISEFIVKTSTIKFKTITENAFKSISSLFADLKTEFENEFPANTIECLYEIRINNHLYSGSSFEEFEKLYKKLYKADYLHLSIQVTNPEQHLNPVLSRVVLNVDKSSESILSVAGDKVTWVNGVFNRFNELLDEVPNSNRMLHNPIVEMTLQLFVVFVIILFSIYSAQKLATSLPFKYSEVYIFAIILLLLSNVLNYSTRGLKFLRSKYYPVVDIIRQPRKPILLTTLSFLAITALSWAIHYLLNLLVASK